MWLLFVPETRGRDLNKIEDAIETHLRHGYR